MASICLIPTDLATRGEGAERSGMLEVADTEGFEPSVEGLPLRLLSREVVSAAHPRVRMVWPEAPYSEGRGSLQRQIDLIMVLNRKMVNDGFPRTLFRHKNRGGTGFFCSSANPVGATRRA